MSDELAPRDQAYMKIIYADNNVVSALRRWDQKPLENDAIREIKARSHNRF